MDGIDEYRVGSIRGAHLVVMNDYSAHGLEQMLTTTELADYLGVASQAIYDLRSAGQGPSAVHIGRELRFRVADVRSWIDSRSESTQDVVRDDR